MNGVIFGYPMKYLYRKLCSLLLHEIHFRQVKRHEVKKKVRMNN